jgi:Phosphatidylserine/phosphatidylglycerophosphate/cardiolipin synthases and related enzymes
MLAATMISDWILETREPIQNVIESAKLGPVKFQGGADVQVVPAGPGETGDGLLQMLLALINAAQNELVLTTPYLVPDESILRRYAGRRVAGSKWLLLCRRESIRFLRATRADHTTTVC